jgi:hypothetical protein
MARRAALRAGGPGHARRTPSAHDMPNQTAESGAFLHSSNASCALTASHERPVATMSSIASSTMISMLRSSQKEHEVRCG